jgi:hypothetical protein
MKYEQERIQRISKLMDEFHELCNAIYEGLADEDFESVKSNLRSLSELIDYVRKSISNEI